MSEKIESPFIDISRFKVAPGYVLVKLGEDVHEDKSTGFLVSRQYEETALFKSRIAEVVKAPDKNFYLGALIHPLMNQRDFGSSDQKFTSRLPQRTTYYDVPIEIKDGDKVVLKHIGLSQEHLKFGGFLIVKYDNLIGRVDDADVYPLNGAIFLEMDDDKRGEVFEGAVNEFGIDFRSGVVKKVGCLVKNYLLFPQSKDYDVTLLGKRVFLSKGAAARIEYDDHQILGKGRPLYATHRHFINGMVEEVIF
jgi:hypothetical protein